MLLDAAMQACRQQKVLCSGPAGVKPLRSSCYSMLRRSCAGSLHNAATSPLQSFPMHAAAQRGCRPMRRHQLWPAALYGRRTDDENLTGAACERLHACAIHMAKSGG